MDFTPVRREIAEPPGAPTQVRARGRRCYDARVMILSGIRRFLERRRFPTLMLIGAALFVLNVIIPDPFPFIDEILLLIATLLIGSFRDWRTERRSDGDRDPGDAES